MKQSSFKIYLLIKAFKKKSTIFLLIAIVIAIFCLPQISSHAFYKYEASDYLSKIRHFISFNSQPDTRIINIYVTAYTSSIHETDDTPCITASGYNLCKHDKENVVACNFLPFGTKISFPDLYENKIYTVVDRMNERYNSRIDIWMKDKSVAKQFGIKHLKVKIYQQ